MGRNRFNLASKHGNNNSPRIAPSEDRLYGHAMDSQSLVGHLLVASPALADTPFAQTVVLVMQQDEKDTFGIVLNRPANHQVADQLKQITGAPLADDLALIHGGPLNGPVFAIHQSEELAEVLIPGGICVSAELDTLRQLEHQFQPYRIVLGMVGWKTAELLEQIHTGQWLTLSSASPDQIFADPEWMWQRAVLEYGRHTMSWVTGFPMQGYPELN